MHGLDESSGTLREEMWRHSICTNCRPPVCCSFAKAWRDALDAIGYPACITVSLWDNGNVVSQTQVHPGGETPVGGGGGITPPVVAPPTITFDRAN